MAEGQPNEVGAAYVALRAEIDGLVRGFEQALQKTREFGSKLESETAQSANKAGKEAGKRFADSLAAQLESSEGGIGAIARSAGKLALALKAIQIGWNQGRAIRKDIEEAVSRATGAADSQVSATQEEGAADAEAGLKRVQEQLKQTSNRLNDAERDAKKLGEWFESMFGFETSTASLERVAFVMKEIDATTGQLLEKKAQLELQEKRLNEIVQRRADLARMEYEDARRLSELDRLREVRFGSAAAFNAAVRANGGSLTTPLSDMLPRGER